MAFDALSERDDAELMRLFANGDQVAAAILTQRLAPGILALAIRMLKDTTEAEDIVQEAMLRLWKIAPDWDASRAKPSTWLYRVASNLCMDRLRKRRFQSDEEMDEPADTAAPVERMLQDEVRRDVLNEAVDTLPERQRTAVHLRHFAENTNIEISEIMGITVEAVEGLLGRAKRSLVAGLAARKTELGYEDD